MEEEAVQFGKFMWNLDDNEVQKARRGLEVGTREGIGGGFKVGDVSRRGVNRTANGRSYSESTGMSAWSALKEASWPLCFCRDCYLYLYIAHHRYS